ncbi:MAG TPA: hypothetical protein VH986_14985 [Acidimicrobiia bacterium]|jgi:hypothetical protein
MVAITPESRGQLDHDTVDDAEALGFELVRYESDTGQAVWEWQRGDEPRPQFVTRRVALHWMREWLARGDDHG